MEQPAAATRVVIASDGRRGHESQSHVIARMLGDTTPIVMRIRAGNERPSLAEAWLRLRFALGAAPGRRSAGELVKRLLRPEDPAAFRELAHEVKVSQGKLSIFTVSAGTSAATMNLLLRQLLGSRAVCAMTPSLLPRQRFSLNIIPAHDLQKGTPVRANVIVSPLALSYHDSRGAQRRATRLLQDLALPADARYLAIAIGGPSKSCEWDSKHVIAQLEHVMMQFFASGWKILATTSRRTPEETTRELRNLMHTCPGFAYLLNARSDPYNPLPAFYELAQSVLVTGDSFNMISETIQAGHRPLVLNTSAKGASGKLGQAVENLAHQGLLSVLSEADSVAIHIDMGQPRGQANEEYAKLRAEVQLRMGLDPNAAPERH